MLVGFRKTSLVDYPGRVAAALFLPGCNLRCPWCHNRELVAGGNSAVSGLTPIEDALEVIRRRKFVLGGVVISGGEPLLNRDLGELIAAIKRDGLSVKLDTNGTLPDELEYLLAKQETAPDYVALDLKIAPERYRFLGANSDAAPWPEAIVRSATILADSGIEHEFRSLALPDGFFTVADVEALTPLVGSAPWFFSAFRPGNCLDDAWNGFPQSAPEAVRTLAEKATALGKDGRTR